MSRVSRDKAVTSLRDIIAENLVMYRLPHEKKNYGFTPNLDFNPLPTRFNFTEFLPPSGEYAAHQGRREEVSMVSV